MQHKNTSDIFSPVTALVPWIHNSSRPMYILVSSSSMTPCKKNYYPVGQGSYTTFVFKRVRTATEKDDYTQPLCYALVAVLKEKKMWAQIQNDIHIRNKELW